MKKIIIFGAFTLALLSSCSNEEVVSTSQNLANKKPLGVTLGIVQNNLNSKAIIGAETNTVFPDNTSVGILIGGVGYPTLDVNSKASVCTHDKLTSTWTISPSLFLSNSDATVYGFYPNPALATDVNCATKTLKVKIPAESKFDGSDLNDYMYATALGEASGQTFTYPFAKASNAADKEKVKLYFHHAMAKLTFKIIKDASYPNSGELTEIKLVNKTANAFQTGDAGTMSFDEATKGQFAALVAPAENTIKLTPPTADVVKIQLEAKLGKLIAGSNEYLAQTLVAPITLITNGDAASDANSINVILTIDGKPYPVYLPKTVASWDAGKNYTYSIKLKGTALTVDPQVSVVGFTESASIGEVTIK